MLVLTLAEDGQHVPEGATVIEFDTTEEAVYFTETDETGWKDPAQNQQASKPELFANG